MATELRIRLGQADGAVCLKKYEREGCVTDKTHNETIVSGSENMQNSLFTETMYGLTFFVLFIVSVNRCKDFTFKATTVLS